MQSAAADSLEAGRDAVKRHAWTEALEAFAAADRDGGLVTRGPRAAGRRRLVGRQAR